MKFPCGICLTQGFFSFLRTSTKNFVISSKGLSRKEESHDPGLTKKHSHILEKETNLLTKFNFDDQKKHKQLRYEENYLDSFCSRTLVQLFCIQQKGLYNLFRCIFCSYLYSGLMNIQDKMRRTQAGPGSSTGNYKSTTDPGKSLGTSTNSGGYRRVGTAAGPASSTTEYTSTLDPGKQSGSSTTSGGYRRVGTAAGPTSSTSEYTSTLDPGKQVGTSSVDSGGYRRVGTAAGPTSSTAEYTPTLDPGVSQAVSGQQP
jgi:hypothetical protein